MVRLGCNNQASMYCDTSVRGLHMRICTVPFEIPTRQAVHIRVHAGEVESEQLKRANPLVPSPRLSRSGLRGFWMRRTRCGPSAAPPSLSSIFFSNPPSSTCSATRSRIRRGGTVRPLKEISHQSPRAGDALPPSKLDGMFPDGEYSLCDSERPQWKRGWTAIKIP